MLIGYILDSQRNQYIVKYFFFFWWIISSNISKDNIVRKTNKNRISSHCYNQINIENIITWKINEQEIEIQKERTSTF